MKTIACSNCSWAYAVPVGAEPDRCPHCWVEAMSVLESATFIEPELVIPFSLDAAAFDRHAVLFAADIPYPPRDLSAANLRRRVRQVFLPRYLVDVSVKADWHAEMGYDYQVVSHQEHFQSGNWRTLEREETRIRWEPRLGRLERDYGNTVVPALDDDAWFFQSLGAFAPGSEEAFGGYDQKSFYRLPNRSHADAWIDAVLPLQNSAAGECATAAGADHVREFRWQAAYTGQHWTLSFQPAYMSYYLDDDGDPQPLIVNGQTGRTSGRRRASMRRAQISSLWMLGAAAVLFILSLLTGGIAALLPPLVAVSGIGLFISVLVAFGSIVPVARAWRFNRFQRPDQ